MKPEHAAIVERLIQGVVDEDKVDPFLTVLEPLFIRSTNQNSRRDMAEALAYVACENKGSLQGSYKQLCEIVGPGVRPRLPSDSTLARNLKRYEHPPYRAGMPFNDIAMWKEFDALFHLIWKAGAQLNNFGAGDFYVTFDKTSMPCYADIAEERIGKSYRKVQWKSESGLVATPQFDDNGKKFAGTRHGHTYLIMYGFLGTSKVGFPLAVRFVSALGPPLYEVVRELLNLLEAYPDPSLLFADREFCTTEISSLLHHFCAMRPDTHFVMPKSKWGGGGHPGTSLTQLKGKTKRQPSANLRLQRGLLRARSVPGMGGALFNVEKWNWSERSSFGRYDHRLVMFYHPKRDQAPSLLDTELVDGGGTRYYATMFLTDLEVTEAQAPWFIWLYGGRWAQENVHERMKDHCLKLPSKKARGRMMGLGILLLVFGCHSLWRLNRAKARQIPLNHEDLGLNLYLKGLQQQILRG